MKTRAPNTRARWGAATLALAVLAGACGDDGGTEAADPYPAVDPSTTTTTSISTSSTTTETVDTTTTEAASPSTTLIDEEISSDNGTTGSYQLFVSDDGALCFTGAVENPDPAIDLGLGTGVSECLEAPWTPLEGDLSVSVGTLDGDKRYGVVWGRASPDIARLEITTDGGDPVPVPLAPNDYGIGLFALVVDTVVSGDGQTLDAYDADETLRTSEVIRGFLRAGPTYPVAPPPPTAPPTTYPTTGG